MSSHKCDFIAHIVLALDVAVGSSLRCEHNVSRYMYNIPKSVMYARFITEQQHCTTQRDADADIINTTTTTTEHIRTTTSQSASQLALHATVQCLSDTSSDGRLVDGRTGADTSHHRPTTPT